MTDQPTHPDTPATLFVRVETPDGPRTMVKGNLTVSSASSIAVVENGIGRTSAYAAARAPVNFAVHLAEVAERRRKETETKRLAALKAPIPLRKKN